MPGKKIIISLSAALVLVLAAGGVIFFFYTREALVMRSPMLVQETPIITYLNGEVFLAEEGSDDWIEPEAGQKLKQGTLLKTGIDGEMDIRLSSETLLKMDNNSLMLLEKSTLKNVNLTLQEGRLYSRFHKLFKDQNITVNTGTVVAGVRGTDLVFESAVDETIVYALSGITEVYNPEYPDEKMLLSFQRSTVVKEGELPSAPRKMEDADIQEFQNTINAIHTETVLLVTRAIQFKANSAEILESSLPELERLQTQIASTKYRIRIIGHTADVGSSGAQLRLSMERAEAIKNYLVDNGISGRRLETNGYGGSKPIADNESDEGKARNRRVEFVIIE